MRTAEGKPGSTWLGRLGGFAPPGPTGGFLQKATSSRLEDITDLPNTWKLREFSKMRRKHMFQMKERDNTSEKNKTAEISNLLDREFKVMVIKCSLNSEE